MKLGADPKKLGVLGVLALVLVWALWPSGADNDRPTTPKRTTSDGVIPTAQTGPVNSTSVRKRVSARGAAAVSGEQRPKIPSDRDFRPDQVDPTIRFDLLAKVQSVPPGEGKRNVFGFGELAPVVDNKPKQPVPRIFPAAHTFIGPIPPPATNVAVVKPPAPPPPPIPLKFYGFSSRTAAKRAFFLDGEDILVGGEGEVLKGRYKIVRIGVNSVVMEDQQFHHQQTLPLLEDQQS